MDGTLHLRVLQADGSSAARTISVEQGRWSCELAGFSRLIVERVLVDGREAWPLEPRVDALSTEDTLTIRARFPAALELSAVDAHDHHLLHDLTAVFDPWGPPTPPATVDPRLVALKRARSPAPLRPTLAESDGRVEVTWLEWMWVRSPGYAWARLRVDFQQERDPIVLVLDPAAELEVVLPDLAGLDLSEENRIAERPLPLRLVVQPPETEWPLVSRPLRTSPVLLGDLPARNVEVRVETVHADPCRSRELASTEVALTGGTRQTVRLTLGELPRWPEPCTLSGTVEVPEEWGDDFSLRLELLEPTYLDDVHDPVVLHERTDRLFSIEPLRVLPGRHRAVIHRFGYATTFEVPETGRADLVLRLPEPAVLDVRLEDRNTGEELLHAYGLSWTWLGEDATPAVPSTPEPGSGRHRCTVPVGTVRLHAHPDGYARERLEVHVRRGVQPVTISLHKHCGLEVQYRVGDSVLSLPWDQVPVQLEALDGEGSVEGTAATDELQWVYVTEPGRYLLTLEAMEGFAPFPPRIVDIPPGTMLRVDLELRRVR